MKCQTKLCRGTVTPAMEARCHYYCHKCKDRRWKERQPISYTFSKLRRRAKARGHSFTLTLDEFKKFVEQTDYMRLKGKTAASLSIDRVRNEEGYHAGNIQVLSLSENTGKNNRLRKAPQRVCERYQF